MAAGGALASATPAGLVVVVFVAGSVAALAASALLVTRLERVGARLGLSEAALGMLAALAANAPEITSAVTALVRGQRQIGAGVVLGSNAFNMAALLGVGALVAGRIRLHRRVVFLAGAAALWLALVALGTAGALFPPGAALGLAAVVFVPYVALSASSRVRGAAPMPVRVRAWLDRAVADEEAELLEAIHPRPATGADWTMALAALAVVLVASVVMERSASSIGEHAGIHPVVVGGVVLAAVTSLPNAVAAVYLARRGRAVAVLSEALNSNNLNVVAGLLVPATILGLGRPGSATVVTALFAAALTAAGLVMAGRGGGVRRSDGAVLVAGYLVFVGVLAVIA